MPWECPLRLPRLFPSLMALLFTAGLPIAAQDSPMTTLRVDVSLVTVGVRVTDVRGRPIPNLSENEFTLYEDRVAQKLAFFSNQVQPISLAILLDHSDSMKEGDKLERAKTAAKLLVDSAYQGTEFLYVPFDHSVDEHSGFTQDRAAVKRRISATTLGRGTSLYDAILTALDRCKHARYGRQAIVIISDGADEHSEHMLDDVIRATEESLVQLYAIGYFSARDERINRRGGPQWITLPSGKTIDNPRYVFQRLAEESGADVFFPRSDHALQTAVKRISKDLRSQYTLGYYPTDPMPDGHYRDIIVKVRGKGRKVRARKGYILPTPSPAPPLDPPKEP